MQDPRFVVFNGGTACINVGFERKIVTMTTMSDVLRFALLEKYGGYYTKDEIREIVLGSKKSSTKKTAKKTDAKSKKYPLKRYLGCKARFTKQI